MGRTRVLRREQERPEGAPLARVKAEAERSSDVEPVAGEVLRLQQAGGNEAVGSMLAQRDAATAMDSGSEKDEAVSTTMIADDPIGVIPVISFAYIGSTKEVSVVLPSTDKDAVLENRCATGRPIGKVKISGKGTTFELAEVVISSCQTGIVGAGRPVLTITLNSSALRVNPPDNPTGTPDKPS